MSVYFFFLLHYRSLCSPQPINKTWTVISCAIFMKLFHSIWFLLRIFAHNCIRIDNIKVNLFKFLDENFWIFNDILLFKMQYCARPKKNNLKLCILREMFFLNRILYDSFWLVGWVQIYFFPITYDLWTASVKRDQNKMCGNQ